MGQTLALADSALKDDYVDPIIRAINDQTYIIDKVARSGEELVSRGRKAVWAIHTKRNRGRKTIAAGGTLPIAGQQGYEDAQATIAYHTYALEIDDAAIEGTKSNEGAFVNLLTEETEGVARDMKQDIARQAYGDGTGLLATVTTDVTTSTTVLLDTVQNLEVGDPIEFRLKATPFTDKDTANAGASTIANIDYSAKSITTAVAVTIDVTGTDVGVYIAGNQNMEMDGLVKLTAQTGILHGIDRSAAGMGFFKARQEDAAGAVAGEELFQKLRDRVNPRGFGNVEDYLTTYGVRRRLSRTYASQRRLNDAAAVTIHGGYTAIYVDETPVLVDSYMPKGRAYAINRKALAWFEQAPPSWLQQKDGSVFHLKNGTVAGTHDAVWQAYFKWYAVLGARKPGALGVIINCEDDAAESA